MRRYVLAAVAAISLLAAFGAGPSLSSVTVKMKDNHYSPNRVTVSKGTTVRWTWNGRHKHDVYVLSGPRKFHSPTKTRGRAFSHRMTARGTYRIVCSQHSGMKMTLKVR